MKPVRHLPFRLARNAVLLTADALGLTLAAFLAYALWALPVHGQPPSLYVGLWPLFFLFLLGYAFAGLYPGFGLGPVETLRRQVLTTGFGFLLLAALSFASQTPYLYSRITFALAAVLSLATVPLVRGLVLRIVARWNWWPEPVIVIGGLGVTPELREEAAEMGYRAVAMLGTIEEAEEAARAGIRVALLDPSHFDRRANRPYADALDQLRQLFRHLVLLRQIDDLPVEGVQIRNLGGGVLGIEYTNNLLQRRNRLLKRTLDLTAGTLFLLLALPVILLAALAVIVVNPGWPFFGQRREGLGGRRITVWKVRTMYRDAEARLERHLDADPELRRQWQDRYKLNDDPRVLPWVGKFLRRYSLDELPQLANVVLGEMSLVGPRPFPDYHLERFTDTFRHLRRRVRPGITGLWQVTVRSEGGVDEQQALDTYYIRNWSLWLDLHLLGRTLSAVLSGRGAY